MKNRKILTLIILGLYLMSLTLVVAQRSTTSGAKSGSQKDTGATGFFMNSLEKGEVKELSLNKRALPVTRISFVPLKTISGDMQVHIRRTYEFPTRQHPRLEDAHSYFEVNTVSLKAEYFGSLEFDLILQKSWLDVRRLSPENVSLYRFNGVWQELPTEFVGAQGTDMIYTAKSPGFSYFGIAASGLTEEIVEEPLINQSEELEKEENTTDYIDEMEYYEEEYEDIDIFEEGIIKDDVRGTLVYWALIAAIMAIFYILSRVVKKKR